MVIPRLTICSLVLEQRWFKSRTAGQVINTVFICSDDNQSITSLVSVVNIWLWPGNRTLLEVASMVVTWRVVAFLHRVTFCSITVTWSFLLQELFLSASIWNSFPNISPNVLMAYFSFTLEHYGVITHNCNVWFALYIVFNWCSRQIYKHLYLKHKCQQIPPEQKCNGNYIMKPYPVVII